MRKTLAVILLCMPMLALGQDQKQDQKPATLRSILLEQLKTTHDNKDWFVPGNIAVEGLTPEQASWTDGKGNHSIGQLANHLVFWNSQVLAKFKGETPPKFNGDNDETFNSFDTKKWNETVKLLAIAHVGMHNAYHIGQIIYIRRLQGSWNPEKGVK